MSETAIQKIDALLAHLQRNDAPGAVVSIQRNGRMLLRQGYGLASLDSGLVNTPATKMRIGSTTKHFACVLALLLREEGKLSIDVPVSRWLPELPATQGQRTLRQFMNHTGGTRDYLDLSLLSNGIAIAPAEAAFDYQCRQQEENFAPGEQFIYNNGGYRMLSMVIERVLGMPLGQVLRERLFEPLSMHETSLWSCDLDPLMGIAATHIALPNGSFSKGIFPAVILGEGGIASTLDDMQRWLAHLVSPTLWPSAISAELMAPTELSNGYVNPYGFGLIRETWRGVELVHHAGGVVGGTCQMIAAPEQGINIVVMSNRSDVTAPELAQKLLAVLLEETMGPPDTPANVSNASALEGDYYCAETGRHYAIGQRDDTLFLKNFGMSLPLTQTTKGALRVNLLSVIALEIDPVRNEQKDVIAINVTEQGCVHHCRRIDSSEKGESMLRSFAGRWSSDELGADVVIGKDDLASMTVLGLYGRSNYKLEALCAETCLIANTDPTVPISGTLRLARGQEGARELMLETSRTRRLRLIEVGAHG